MRDDYQPEIANKKLSVPELDKILNDLSQIKKKGLEIRRKLVTLSFILLIPYCLVEVLEIDDEITYICRYTISGLMLICYILITYKSGTNLMKRYFRGRKKGFDMRGLRWHIACHTSNWLELWLKFNYYGEEDAETNDTVYNNDLLAYLSTIDQSEASTPRKEHDD